MTSSVHVSSERIREDLETITMEFGVRLAGSEAEKGAVEYIRRRFAEIGIVVNTETFPVRERAVRRERLWVRIRGSWVPFACSLFSNAPGTEGQNIEAPLCFFEPQTEYQRRDLSFIEGKAVVYLAAHFETKEQYRRLMEARPAFLLMVDVRYPGEQPLADGLFPEFVRSCGAIPTVNVAYQDAWRWRTEQATEARLLVEGGMRDSVSRTVVAELPTSVPNSELLVVAAHHDTQAGSRGADDNASGVAALLETARLLEPLPRRRIIRLISFGAEEQLSVGSAEYVRRHRHELQAQGRFMLNFDAIGSHLGWTCAVCNGPSDMTDFVSKTFDNEGFPVKISEEITPFSDHFPFVAAGIPAVFLHRQNCTAGRFFHHRHDDDLARVSVSVVARTVEVVVHMLSSLARGPRLPFPGHIPESKAREAQELWSELFGGWGGR
ncbi:MAG: M28 family peptidase [Kiritimatiellae bacterium]|nr:M28 family peptidase [Kiritimatiellia bacterium]